MLLVLSQCLNIYGLIMGEIILAKALGFALVYIYCKRSPFDRVSFMFGLIVNSGYLPYVILGYDMITG